MPLNICSSISYFLTFFRRGRLLVGCWSLVGLLVGRFVGRSPLFNLPKLPFYNGYNRKLVGRSDGYFVGRFKVFYCCPHLALTHTELFRPRPSAKHALTSAYRVSSELARLIVGFQQDVQEHSQSICVSVPPPIEYLSEDLYVCSVILH